MNGITSSQLPLAENAGRQRLSRTFRAECVNRITPVDPVEHVGELRGRDRDAAAARRRPHEPPALEPLRIERHAETVTSKTCTSARWPEDLDHIAASATKHEQIAGEGIALQRLLHLQREPVHAAPHVGAPDREPNAHAPILRRSWRKRNHRPFFRTPSARATRAPSARLNRSRMRPSARSSKLDPTRTR